MLQFNEMELFPVWSRIFAFLSLRCLMNMERTCRKMQYYVHTVYQNLRLFNICQIINQKRNFTQETLPDLTQRCRLLMQWIAKKAKNVHSVGDLNSDQLWSIDYKSRDISLLCECLSRDLLPFLCQLQNLRSVAFPKGFVKSADFLNCFHKLSSKLQHLDLTGLDSGSVQNSEISTVIPVLLNLESLLLDEAVSYLLPTVVFPLKLIALTVCVEDITVMTVLRIKCVNLTELNIVGMTVQPQLLLNILRSCQQVVNLGFQTDISDYRAFAPGCSEFERILTLKFGASYVSDMSESHPSFRPIVQAFSNVIDLHLINQSDLFIYNYGMKLSSTVMVDLTQLAGAKHLQKLRLNNLMSTDDFGVPITKILLPSSLTEIEFELSATLYDAAMFTPTIAYFLRGISLIDHQKNQVKKLTIKNVPLIWNYSVFYEDGTERQFRHSVFAALIDCFTQLDELYFESAFDWPTPCSQKTIEMDFISMYTKLNMKAVSLIPNCFRALQSVIEENEFNVKPLLRRSVKGLFDGRKGYCIYRKYCMPPNNRQLSLEVFASSELHPINDRIVNIVICRSCQAQNDT